MQSIWKIIKDKGLASLNRAKFYQGMHGQMKPGDKSSLVSVLHELGSACCEPAILEDILTQILPNCKNLESQIAQSIFMIVQNSVTDHAWNSEVFTEVVLRAVRLSIIHATLFVFIFKTLVS